MFYSVANCTGACALTLGQRTHIRTVPTSDHTTIAVSGDVDLTVTAELHDQLHQALRQRPASLLIDFADVGFCSADGLSVLLDLVTTAHAADVPVAIITGQHAVLRPIRMLELDHVLPLHRDRVDAEAWLSLLTRLR
ncbi:STAS domain-containing protein [Amycolatopsis sp. NPDC098790]|uniref:STAS domain-containing protein n=1 Tax=Amycolatopsis sp. NPDC098790 TaxID=3363939 RepID=UPI0037F65C03